MTYPLEKGPCFIESVTKELIIDSCLTEDLAWMVFSLLELDWSNQVI